MAQLRCASSRVKGWRRVEMKMDVNSRTRTQCVPRFSSHLSLSSYARLPSVTCASTRHRQIRCIVSRLETREFPHLLAGEKLKFSSSTRRFLLNSRSLFAFCYADSGEEKYAIEFKKIKKEFACRQFIFGMHVFLCWNGNVSIFVLNGRWNSPLSSRY